MVGRADENGPQGSGINEDVSFTLNTVDRHAVAYPSMVLDNHPQDSRITIREDGMAPTLTEKMGTGGNNVPMVMEPAVAFDCRNLAPNIEVSATLQAKSNGGQSLNYINPVFQPVPINDKATRCGGGGVTRNDDGAGNGLGIGKPGDPAPTLTAGDRHAVAYGVNRQMFNCGSNSKIGFKPDKETSPTLVGAGPGAVAYPATVPEISGTLTAKMAKGTGGPAGDEMQNLVAEYPDYIVRRFTPLECGRLQGFPDWWTEDLGIEEPSTGQIDRWVEFFKTHWKVIGQKDGAKAPKTRNQVIKWLKNPASDTALYKMWGNGIALPCAMFVLEGIAAIAAEESECER